LKSGFIFPREVSHLYPIILIHAIVQITAKGRIVTVKGKKGEITKDFRHMPVELQVKK